MLAFLTTRTHRYAVGVEEEMLRQNQEGTGPDAARLRELENKLDKVSTTAVPCHAEIGSCAHKGIWVGGWIIMMFVFE